MFSKQMLVKLAAGVGVAIVVVALAASVGATTATANLAVSATVANNCTISTSEVAFGAYDPIGTNATNDLDGTGTVTVTCTKGWTNKIELDLGANPSGSTRRMVGAGTGDFLSYELYSNSGRSTVWGTGAAALTPAAAPSKAARDFTVYGRIAKAQDVSADTYGDTITATVNY